MSGLRCILMACAMLVAGCASVPVVPTQVFVLTRHAEKGTDDPRDPSLSAAGTARARALAAWLHADNVVAVYATAYRRTQQTAAPIAQGAGVDVITYDASGAAGSFAARLRAAHPAGTVVVVGHSNTVPELAAALCGCSVPPMADDDFGTVHRITIAPGQPARLDTRRD